MIKWNGGREGGSTYYTYKARTIQNGPNLRIEVICINCHKCFVWSVPRISFTVLKRKLDVLWSLLIRKVPH
jgi:hypothetical protein